MIFICHILTEQTDPNCPVGVKLDLLCLNTIYCQLIFKTHPGEESHLKDVLQSMFTQWGRKELLRSKVTPRCVPSGRPPNVATDRQTHPWFLPIFSFPPPPPPFFLATLRHMELPEQGIRSKPQPRTKPQLWQCQIFNPLCQARDRTHISVL